MQFYDHGLVTCGAQYILITDHLGTIKYQSEAPDTIDNLDTNKKFTHANKAEMHKQANYNPVLHLKTSR